jgi:hypothetical protein
MGSRQSAPACCILGATRATGCRQGHPGGAALPGTRHPPHLHRARCCATTWPAAPTWGAGQGDHGRRRPGPRRHRDRHGGGAARQNPTPPAASCSTASPAPPARPRLSRRPSPMRRSMGSSSSTCRGRDRAPDAGPRPQRRHRGVGAHASGGIPRADGAADRLLRGTRRCRSGRRCRRHRRGPRSDRGCTRADDHDEAPRGLRSDAGGRQGGRRDPCEGPRGGCARVSLDRPRPPIAADIIK